MLLILQRLRQKERNLHVLLFDFAEVMKAIFKQISNAADLNEKQRKVNCYILQTI